MTATKDVTAGESGGNGDALPEPAMNAPTQATLGDNMPRWQPNARLLACGKTLPMFGTCNIVVEQGHDGRGPRLSGESRSKPIAGPPCS